MKVTISTGKSRKETRWKVKEVEWERLVDRLRTPLRTSDTVASYRTASKERRAELKDVGGFVGGAVIGGRRVRGSVTQRSLLTLDLDYAYPDSWDDFTMGLDCAGLMYSTHSHTPEAPRFRLIIPLSRLVNVDEHEAIARKVADIVGIDQFDDSTYQAERLMYFPSTPQDGEYIFLVQEGEPLNADEMLSRYNDWRDTSQWAVSSRVDRVIRREMRRKGEPTEKPGILGAFCRTYGIAEAIETFIPDVYKPTANDDSRYTYMAGSSAGGLIVYDDKFAYSHHATDPCGGQLCNAFDLVRIHLYGDMDSDARSDTPINKLPSYLEMERRASADEHVKNDLNEQVMQRLRDDFGDMFDYEDESEDTEWMQDLERDRNNGIKSTSNNILLILDNAAGLKNNVRRNLFTHCDEVRHDLPWRKVRMPMDLEWSNDDDARLRVHLEKYYNIQGKEKIINCFTEIVTSHAYHPVRGYLSSLQWDGISRAETLLIDYLGAEDTPLTRAVTRKFLAAAVARVYDPGVKFDYVTVLQGRQGIGKSTLLAKLAGSAWFNDSLTDLNGKDAMEMLQGSWIIELGELQAIKRSEIENIKSFLSRQVDAYRPAYGRVRENHPRQCVFFATTNEEAFLKGTDGNRRFWVVSCSGYGSKDVFAMDDYERDQIWAEAVRLYEGGETLYLDDASETEMRDVQAEYNEEVNDVRLGIIGEYLDKKLPPDWRNMSPDQRTIYLADEDMIVQRGAYVRDKVCAAEIMVECFNERIDERSKYKVKEYNALMRKLPGWKAMSSPSRFSIYGVQRGFERVDV